MVIFGRGYGFETWEQFSWLHEVDLYYWGDIDTHGYAILNQFRNLFPKTKSIHMDEQTLLSSRDLWVEETTQTLAALDRLNDAERRVYYRLFPGAEYAGVRLEQEYIPIQTVNNHPALKNEKS